MTRSVDRTTTARLPIITLTTDFGLDDWYVAIVKAVLLKFCPHARLIDVTHRIPPGDRLKGSISLERAVAGFPEDTVHLAVVDPGVGSNRRMLIVHAKRQWVVCPDNGLITWTWHRHPGCQAYELTWRPDSASATFHGRDIMGPVAGMLAAGRGVEDFGIPIADPILLDAAPVPPTGRSGKVIHCDSFGNATTNIPEEVIRPLPNAEISVAGRHLGGLKRTYTDVAPGAPLVLIGSSGLLEIAVRDGSAVELLGVEVGDPVTILSSDRAN